MDWLDHYLDGLSDGTNVVFPPDNNTWRPVKPTKQQQSMIQDSIISDMVRIRMIREAREELEAHPGDYYDTPLNVIVLKNIDVTPTITPTPTTSVTPTITPTPTPSVTPTITPTPTSTQNCSVSCSVPSFYVGFDNSGSMNTRDVVLNGNTSSRAELRNALFNNYPSLYKVHETTSNLCSITKSIKSAINLTPSNSELCSFLFIGDITDSYDGCSLSYFIQELNSAMVGKIFKIDIYIVGISNIASGSLTEPNHISGITMINAIGNNLPSYVNNFTFQEFKSYNSSNTQDPLNQLMDSFSGYACKCGSDIIRVGGVNDINSAIQQAELICC